MLYDYQAIREFFDMQTTLQDNEVFIILAGARKKYDSQLSKSYEIIFHDLIKSNDYQRFYHKLQRLNSNMKHAVDFNTNLPISPLASVIYFKPNPQDVIKGYMKFAHKMQDILYDSMKNTDNISKFKNMNRYLFSSIHKSNSRKIYGLIDIDVKNKLIVEFFKSYLQSEIAWITETRGGYHIIYNIQANKILYSKEFKQKFTEFTDDNAINKDAIEFKNTDFITVIWGTLQGGFKVKKYST